MADLDQQPNLYALLIGINFYLPNRLPDGSCYKNLGGCVRDINNVEAFLKQERNVSDSHILKLTASSHPDDPTQPLEAPEQLPTYQNIKQAFRQLGAMAPEGAQIYIHYSGHGGRAKTVYPDVKGAEEIDEGLVPTDIGQPEGQYLRDLELVQLLRELTQRKLTVTLVLDCCHSGGATRGTAEIRGSDVPGDKPLLPEHGAIAPEARSHFAQLFGQQGIDGTPGTVTRRSLAFDRNLTVWNLIESKRYVVLAACRPHEFAYEYAFNRDTREKNGALTYWLLDTLRQQNPGQSYDDLHDRINAKIHSQFPQQTPMLIGSGNLKIFGNELAEVVYAISVQKVGQNLTTGEPEAVLAVGQANGATKGAEFAIYPWGTTNFTQKENRIAIATIIERGATESVCKLTPIEGKPRVDAGDQAVQIAPSIHLVRKVSLWSQPEATFTASPHSLRSDIFQQQARALAAIKAALPGNGWVELDEQTSTSDDKQGVNFIVAVNHYGEYEICDSAGVPFNAIRPALSISDPSAPAQVVKRLVHLTKYQAIAEIDNTDIDSPLAGQLAVEWLGTSETYERGDPFPRKFTPFANPAQPSVKAGTYIFLSIRNNSTQTLNIAILNLESNWMIEQIYPYRPSELFIPLEPGKEEKVPLKPTIEGDSQSVENIVKVFATVGPLNCRWLELPSLDEPIAPKGFVNRSNDPLELLLKAIAAEQPKTRKLTVAASPSREWTTRQTTLTIER